MRPDGTDQRNLTASPHPQLTPNYSTDGRMLSYQSYEAGNPNIWVRELVEPHRVWQVTDHPETDWAADLGSPRVQTDRVLIGPSGSDRGEDPIWANAHAAILAFDTDGYGNLVRVGVPAAHLSSLQVRPLAGPGTEMAGAEISATRIVNLREDAGWGKFPLLWDFNPYDAGTVLMYFHATTGKLVAAVIVEDSVYPSDADADPAATYTASAEAGGVRLTGEFAAVFGAEGTNLAPAGATEVRLDGVGEVLAVN